MKKKRLIADFEKKISTELEISERREQNSPKYEHENMEHALDGEIGRVRDRSLVFILPQKVLRALHNRLVAAHERKAVLFERLVVEKSQSILSLIKTKINILLITILVNLISYFFGVG